MNEKNDIPKWKLNTGITFVIIIIILWIWFLYDVVTGILNV